MKKIHKKIIQAKSNYLARVYKSANQKKSRRFRYSGEVCRRISAAHGRYILQTFEVKERIKHLSESKRASLFTALYQANIGWIDTRSAFRAKIGRQRRLSVWCHYNKVIADHWFTGSINCD